MEDDPARRTPTRGHRRWTPHPLLVLLGGCLAGGTVAWRIGWCVPAEAAVIVLWTVAAMVAGRFDPRTTAGRVGCGLTIALTLGVGLAGSDAIRGTVLERDGKPAYAVVGEVRTGGYEYTPSCLVGNFDGRALPRELTPCEGFAVGDRVGVTYDPAGRQNSVEGAPDPGGALHRTAGLLVALTLLALSGPLWAARPAPPDPQPPGGSRSPGRPPGHACTPARLNACTLVQ
ncbi:hypothetical protein ACFC6L_07790 [Kitasatospora phosalacinea]|uniref:hypothetical protein n=1 Tax=Kitasatospora phosalacinea TaxID=2065 RepID=UPI0035D63BEC